MKYENLVKKFIDNCDNFWNDDFNIDLDSKHKKNLENFEKIYKNKINLFVRNLINWEGQTDLGAPWQISYEHLKKNGSLYTFINFLKSIKRKLTGFEFEKEVFFDDYEIIKLTKANQLLEKYPVHKFPLEKNFFFLNRKKKISANYRWLRYIYLANKILSKNIIDNSSSWLDIGSYYGGIQSIVKKELPNLKIILCDFNNQLCRSYVNLYTQFPDCRHILPKEAVLIKKLSEIENGSIIYLPASNFKNIMNSEIDLLTNFFSFGEMKRNTFLNYFRELDKSQIKYVYLANRFVSSPFFEKTYDTDLNIFDYISTKYKKIYFDVFPIHHYIMPKRTLFNRNNKRPMSSPYFEMLLKKND